MKPEVRTRLVTLGTLSSIFGLGVLFGVAADRTVMDSVSFLASTTTEATTPADTTDTNEENGRSRWLIHQVDLSQDQRVFVDSVVSFYRAEVRALSTSYEQAYWEAIQATRDALRAVLDPEQRAEYDALLEARDQSRGRGDRDESR
jgi:Spy/CpxP family protein refolding chaperone